MRAKNILLTITVVIIALSIFFILTIRHYKRWENEFGEFRRLEKQDSVDSKFLILRVYKGYTYLRVEDGRQFVFNELRNYNYDPASFDELIGKCDMIVKDAGSDSVVIYSQNSGLRYWFDLKGNIARDPNATD